MGCRTRAPQAELVRFVSDGEGFRVDAGRVRSPGRGAYLCSPACALRAAKNRRYPGLGAAASVLAWKGPPALSGDEPDVYDSAGPQSTIRGISK